MARFGFSPKSCTRRKWASEAQWHLKPFSSRHCFSHSWQYQRSFCRPFDFNCFAATLLAVWWAITFSFEVEVIPSTSNVYLVHAATKIQEVNRADKRADKQSTKFLRVSYVLCSSPSTVLTVLDTLELWRVLDRVNIQYAKYCIFQNLQNYSGCSPVAQPTTILCRIYCVVYAVYCVSDAVEAKGVEAPRSADWYC